MPARQPDRVPPCLKEQAGLSCSTPAIPVPGQGLCTSFFFPPFFFEKARIKAGSPSFPYCHLPWVESSLTVAGNSNNKKQAPNFNASYFHTDVDSRQTSRNVPKTLAVANVIYTFPLPTTAVYHC